MTKIDCAPGFALQVILLCIFAGNRTANAFFLAVLLHEAAHLAVIAVFGGKIQKIRLNFADCVIQTQLHSYGRELIAVLAGPACNLLLYQLCRREHAAFSVINLLLAFYNLLPVLPLDGGRALQAGLCLFLEPSDAMLICRFTGLAVLACLGAICICAAIYWKFGVLPIICCVSLLTNLARIGSA